MLSGSRITPNILVLSEHLLAAPRRRVSFLDVSLYDVLEPRPAQRQSRRGFGGTPQIVPSRRPSLQGLLYCSCN